jgi:hypothetical protein
LQKIKRLIITAFTDIIQTSHFFFHAMTLSLFQWLGDPSGHLSTLGQPQRVTEALEKWLLDVKP